MDVKPIVKREVLVRHGIEFPEWGSCGDWAFLIARLSACGVEGKLLRRVGYLYRLTGQHDSSTLRGVEEQLRVVEFLADDRALPAASRERLMRCATSITRRLVVAALREHNWTKLARYARRNPSHALGAPSSVLKFLWRRVAYAAARRERAAGPPPGAGRR